MIGDAELGIAARSDLFVSVSRNYDSLQYLIYKDTLVFHPPKLPFEEKKSLSATDKVPWPGIVKITAIS